MGAADEGRARKKGNRKGDAELVLCAARRFNRQRDSALLGELHGIIDQVFQRRAQPHGIADDQRRQLVRDLEAGLKRFRRRPAGERIAGVAGYGAQVEQIPPQCRGITAPRRIDKQGRKAGKMFRARLDRIYPAPLALIQIRGRE